MSTPLSTTVDVELEPLLVQIRAGDAQALARLYELTINRVYGLCLRILRQPADAEEVAIDVYTQIWDQADRFDPQRGPVLAWLLTIARSRALDRLRKLGRQHHNRQQHLHDPENAYNDHEQMPLPDLLDMTASGDRIHTALNELAPAQRQAIALNFLEGLSHQEIAERLDTPLGTVKSNIRRGLLRLRQLLDGNDAQHD